MSSCPGYRVFASIPGLHHHSGAFYYFDVDSVSARVGCLALLVDKSSLANLVFVSLFNRIHVSPVVTVLAWDAVMHDQNGNTRPIPEGPIETKQLEQVRRMVNLRYALEPDGRLSDALADAGLRVSWSKEFFLGR